MNCLLLDIDKVYFSDIDGDYFQVLTKFVDGAEELEVQGHKLTREDVRIMYSFAGERAAELGQKYEADSSEDVLVLLDTTPDASMLEEGVAREVRNRIYVYA